MAEKLQGAIKIRRVESIAIPGAVSTHYYIDTNPGNSDSLKYRIMDMELGSPLTALIQEVPFEDKLRKAALDQLNARFSIAQNAEPPLDRFYSGWVAYGSLNILQKGQGEYNGMGR